MSSALQQVQFLETENIQKTINDLRTTGSLNNHSYSIMNDLFQKIPELRPYIGYTITGSGFGVSVIYTLSFPGIQKVLDLLKINAKVTETLKEIQTNIPKENGQSILITHRGMLQQGKEDHHAIVLYIEKTNEGFITFVDDCEYISVDAYSKGIRALFPESAKVIQVYCGIVRQRYGQGSVCSCLAINTAGALDQNPNLMKELFRKNRLQSYLNKPHVVTNLPSSIIALDVYKGGKQQIEYQAMIAESFIKKEHPKKKTCTRKFFDTIKGLIRLKT